MQNPLLDLNERFENLAGKDVMLFENKKPMCSTEALRRFTRTELCLQLEWLREEVENIDVNGGGSGRRLKEQFLSLIDTQLKELDAGNPH